MPTPTRRRFLLSVLVVAAAGLSGCRAAPEGPTAFRCPMHPAVVMAAKGTCPTCGMELVERPLDAAARDGAGEPRGAEARPATPGLQYTCPMHPAFVAHDPRARCPECGMALVVKPPDSAPPPAPSAPR